MLRAVQEERSSAQQPDDQAPGKRQTDDEPDAIGNEHETERSENRKREKEPLASARDTGTAKERRQGGAQLQEAAQQRDPVQRTRRRRHPALAKRAVHARERPIPLAHDHDAVGASHPAQTGQGCRLIGAVQDGEDGGPLHLCIVATRTAARQVPGGPYQVSLGPTDLGVTSTRARRSRVARARGRRSG